MTGLLIVLDVKKKHTVNVRTVILLVALGVCNMTVMSECVLLYHDRLIHCLFLNKVDERHQWMIVSYCHFTCSCFAPHLVEVIDKSDTRGVY